MPSRRVECYRKSRMSRWTKISTAFGRSQIWHLCRKLLKELLPIKLNIIWRRTNSTRSCKQLTRNPTAQRLPSYGFKNDILRAIDNKNEVILVLLDLSAAFDTIDHEILVRRLHTAVWIHTLVLFFPGSNRTSEAAPRGQWSDAQSQLPNHLHLVSLRDQYWARCCSSSTSPSGENH